MKQKLRYLEWIIYITGIIVGLVMLCINNFNLFGFNSLTISILITMIICVITITIKEGFNITYKDSEARAMMINCAVFGFVSVICYYVSRIGNFYNNYKLLNYIFLLIGLVISVVLFVLLRKKLEKDDKPKFKVNNNRK